MDRASHAYFINTFNCWSPVEAPWEIYSFENFRVIDLYTKTGAIDQYSSMTFLLVGLGLHLNCLDSGSRQGTDTPALHG